MPTQPPLRVDVSALPDRGQARRGSAQAKSVTFIEEHGEAAGLPRISRPAVLSSAE